MYKSIKYSLMSLKKKILLLVFCTENKPNAKDRHDHKKVN